MFRHDLKHLNFRKKVVPPSTILVLPPVTSQPLVALGNGLQSNQIMRTRAAKRKRTDSNSDTVMHKETDPYAADSQSTLAHGPALHPFNVVENYDVALRASCGRYYRLRLDRTPSASLEVYRLPEEARAADAPAHSTFSGTVLSKTIPVPLPEAALQVMLAKYCPDANEIDGYTISEMDLLKMLAETAGWPRTLFYGIDLAPFGGDISKWALAFPALNLAYHLRERSRASIREAARQWLLHPSSYGLFSDSTELSRLRRTSEHLHLSWNEVNALTDYFQLCKDEASKLFGVDEATGYLKIDWLPPDVAAELSLFTCEHWIPVKGKDIKYEGPDCIFVSCNGSMPVRYRSRWFAEFLRAVRRQLRQCLAVGRLTQPNFMFRHSLSASFSCRKCDEQLRELEEGFLPLLEKQLDIVLNKVPFPFSTLFPAQTR